MAKFTNPLDGVRVAAQCPADWSKMAGDERVRYCGECNLHVYNLSGMTRREAETLVTNAEGRLCVRFYRRADGTVLTRNCPVGLRALKRRAARIATATLTAVLGFFAGVGLNFGVNRAVAPPVVGEMRVPAPQYPNVDSQGIGEDSDLRNQVHLMGAIAITRRPSGVNDGEPTVGKVRVEPNRSK
jgi:hypothetical protein